MKSIRTATLLLIVLGVLGTAVLPFTARSLTWSAPATVPTPAGFHSDPKATQDLSQSNIWLFYSSLRVPAKSELYYMKYNPAFGTWQSEIPVTQNTEEDNSPAVTTLSNGTIILFWAAKRVATGPSFDVYSKRLTSGLWSTESRLTTSTLDDDKPSILQDRSGKIWVAWNRNVTGNIEIFYNVYDNGLWQGETRLTNQVGEDKLASLAQTKDGRIWMVWASRASQAVTSIWYMTFNGTSWSTPTQLAMSGDGDIDPSIVQARDGTIWVVWTRIIKVGNDYFGDLYYTNSTSNGASWTTPAALFTTNSLDELQPSIRQFDDRRLWIFFSRIDQTAGAFTLNYINSAPIQNVHDLRMDSLSASPTSQLKGGTVTLTARFTNLGDFLETAAHLTITANGTLLADTTTTVRVGETIAPSFTWNTASFSPGPYLLTATVTIPSETIGNTQDNTVTMSFMLSPSDKGSGCQCHQT